MDIKLNTPVEYFDGERAGHVTGFILNPKTDELTHLIIKIDGVERLVPATLIRDATQTAVRLDRTVASPNKQQPLVETEYVRSMVEHYDLDEMRLRYVPETYTVRHEQIPNGEEVIKRGMAVFAKDGRIGHIDEVLVDPANGHITHLVLRKGHLWGAKEVIVGIAHVKSVEDDGIYLKSTKAQASEFPTIHSGDS
jgi:sporulation protein YlmC with PRC-barrel domain